MVSSPIAAQTLTYRRLQVPSFPLSLLDRLRFLEDHIIHLEKEYPPWAALHFNQPRRGVRYYCEVIRKANVLTIVVAPTTSTYPNNCSISPDLNFHSS